MLLQICRHPVGSLNGVRLESFRPGVTYDIGPQLAAVFMAEGWAEPITSEVTHPTQRPPPEGVGARYLRLLVKRHLHSSSTGRRQVFHNSSYFLLRLFGLAQLLSQF